MTRHWVALAKINDRYYWAVEDPHRLYSGSDSRIEDGFADSREAGVDALAAAIERADPGSAAWLRERAERPWTFDDRLLKTGNRYGASNEAKAFYDNPGKGWSWARAYTGNGHFARRLYKEHHARKPKPSSSHEARGDDLGYLYTWWEPYDYEAPGRWIEHKITKVTAKKVFVLRDTHPARQYTFDRAKLESTGKAWFRQSTASRWFYTKAAVDALEAEQAERRKEWRSIQPEEGNLLGISGECTRAEIMKAFREKSKLYHPDQGGTNEQFRQLCEAKDKALMRVRAAA